MLSLGTLSARASRMAFASFRFMSGLPPPSLAAIWMARQSFDHSLPRRASAAPFLCLMVAQWECPDMRTLYRPHRARSIPASRRGSARGRHSRTGFQGGRGFLPDPGRLDIVTAMNISPDVRTNTKELIALRRLIHQYPEQGFKEFKTAALVRSKLKSWGIDHKAMCGTG